MTNAIPFDEQIVATLKHACTSGQAAAVLGEARSILADLTAQADAADVASLDPCATSVQARELRSKASDSRFDADRMEASVSALEARVADLRDEEARARRDAAREAALALRDKLAKEIADRYPAIVAELTGLAKRIVESDSLCRSNGIDQSAEAIGRGVPNNFYVGAGPVTRIQHILLPMPKDARQAWGYDMTSGWTFRGLDAAG